MGACHGGCFKDFVIQSDRQLPIREAETNYQPQLPPENPRLRNRLTPEGIHERFMRQFDCCNGKDAGKPLVQKRINIDHNSNVAQPSKAGASDLLRAGLAAAPSPGS